MCTTKLWHTLSESLACTEHTDHTHQWGSAWLCVCVRVCTHVPGVYFRFQNSTIPFCFPHCHASVQWESFWCALSQLWSLSPSPTASRINPCLPLYLFVAEAQVRSLLGLLLTTWPWQELCFPCKIECFRLTAPNHSV